MKPSHCLLATLPMLALLHPASAGELADPTRPVGLQAAVAAATPTQAAATNANAELKLEAILLAGGRRLAIVNGKLLRVGESLDGARIDAISSDGVLYSRAGRSHTLRLAEQAIPVRRRAVPHEAKP